MAYIAPHTFEVDEVQNPIFQGTKYVSGTVEVTVSGKTRRVAAYRGTYPATGDTIVSRCLGVKYPTGSKVWPGSITHAIATGKERVDGGFDNRATHSRIASVVGFYDDVPEDARSARRGLR